MNKKQLLLTVDSYLEKNFQSKIIERGFYYFSSGNITDFDFTNDKLTATVLGTQSYKVEIHLENLQYSSCDCPYESNCKHMVSVLFELKKLLTTTTTLSTLVECTYSLTEPNEAFLQIKEDLSSYVNQMYQLLSKSGHFSNDQSKLLVKQFFEELETSKTDNKDRFIILTMTSLMEQLYLKANEYETYRFRQNRFLAYFNELFHNAYSYFKKEVLSCSLFSKWYTKFLFLKLEQFPSSPYETLLATWLLCEENPDLLKKHAQLILTQLSHVEKSNEPLI